MGSGILQGRGCKKMRDNKPKPIEGWKYYREYMQNINLPKYEDIRWIHQIRLPDGWVTPGKWPPLFEEYGLTEVDFKEKRVIDIGCLDGQYSFYAERQGASEVVAIDINEEQFGKQLFTGQNWSYGFLYAHKQFNSKVKYVFPYSVYDLSPSSFGQFDVVLFLGVIYHLVHPVLSLERINKVLKRGGVMVLEAEISNTNTMFCHKLQYNTHKFPVINTDKISPESHAKKARRLFNFPYRLFRLLFLKLDDFRLRLSSISKRVITVIIPSIYGSEEIYKEDTSNFWIMDRVVLERIIDFSGFKIEKAFSRTGCRMSYICRKVSEFDSAYADHSKYSDYPNRITNFFVEMASKK